MRFAKIILATYFVLFGAVASFGQSVQQSGTVSPGHLSRWIASGVIGDAGSGTNPFSTTFGWYANGGLPGCVIASTVPRANFDPNTSPHQDLCLRNTQGGIGGLTLNSYNGAAAGNFSININGQEYPFPAGGTGTGNVTGPGSSTVGDVACWNNTSGTLLSDCGPNGNYVTTNAVLATTAIATYPSGVWRLDYASGRGASPLFYAPETGSCAFNSRVNDGGSCTNSTDGNSWVAQFPGTGADIRQFGAVTSSSDNSGFIQAAFNAAFTLGIPVLVCGDGTFQIEATVYYYETPVIWCSHLSIVKKAFVGPAFVDVDAVGHTYPQAEIKSPSLVRPTVDMNLQAGAGIVMAATEGWSVIDPWVYNIPPNNTTAPSVSGAPVGTWSYTNSNGTGWVVNAGIALLGDANKNVENGRLNGGFVGNYELGATPNNCNATKGAAGIAITIPSQLIGNPLQAPNPGNANVFTGTLADCNTYGVRNDYGSGNVFENLDTTYSDLYGFTIGTPGRVDYNIGGSNASAGNTVVVRFNAASLSGSPITITYTCSSGDTPAVSAAGLAAAINANGTLSAAGIIAGVWPGTSVVHIDYGDEFGGTEQAVNFFPSATGNPIITWMHSISWNVIRDSSGENTGVANIYIGANVSGAIVDNPQQLTGTSKFILANHAGTGGALNIDVRTNMALNAFSGGTNISSSGTIDCLNDQQPYQVNTTSAAITLTLAATIPYGTKCTFTDADGKFGTNALTIASPTSASAGFTTILGNSTQVYSTNYNSGNAIRLKNFNANYIPY